MIKKKLLYKIVTLYLIVILLYTAFAGGLTLHKELEIYSLKDNHTNSLYMDQVRNYSDSKIDLALKFMHQFSTLPSMLDYKYSTEDNYIYLTNVYNQLTDHLAGFTQLGFSIGVINSNSDIVIAPEGTLKYSKYLNSLGLYEEPLEDLDALFSTLTNGNTFVVPQKFMKVDSNLIIMISRINDYINHPNVYYFTTLDTRSLLPAQPTDDNPYAFSIYKDGLIYSISNNYQIHQKETLRYLQNNEVTTDLIGLKLGSFTNYICQSEVIPGLQYIYTVKNVSVFGIFLGILKNIFIPSMLIFSLGLLIAYKAIKSSYAPITQLLKLFDNLHTDPHILNENIKMNELDYIKKGIEKVYSDNHNLRSRLDSSLLSLQEDFFRKILYAIEDSSFIDENITKFSLDSFKNNLTLVLFELEGLNMLTQMVPIQELSGIIKNIIHNFSYTDEGIDFFVLLLDYKKYCIVTQNLSTTQLETLSTQIIESVSENLGLDAVACISSSYDLINLSSAFQEVLMLSKNKYSSLNRELITAKHIEENADITYYYPLEVETYLINYVTTNEHSKATTLLSDILEKNIVDYNIDSDTLTHLKYSLLATFKRCLNTEDYTLSHFNKEHSALLNEFVQAPISQIHTACLTLFEAIFSYCNDDALSLENPTASSIFMYIHENFETDISLTDIANHFNLSTSYISKLFKNSVGTNFKRYVNKLKVQKSKELLATGTYQVNEVATLVGCNSVNTFIRIFKQYESISPGEYVKSLNP